LWAEGGHASDVVLTALADGQNEIVPSRVVAHVHGCRACTTHLGNAALLSLHTGAELGLAGREADAAARAPFPRLAVALGLAFAALGLLPTLLDAPASLGGVRTFATHDVPLLATACRTLGHRLLEPGSPLGITLTYGALALVVIMAFALVRLLPKKEASR
jgi:hypothetical protein